MDQAVAKNGPIMLRVAPRLSEDKQIEQLSAAFKPYTEPLAFTERMGLIVMEQRLAPPTAVGEAFLLESGLEFANAVRLRHWVFALARKRQSNDDWVVVGYNEHAQTWGLYEFPLCYRDVPRDNGTLRGQWMMQMIIEKAIPILFPKLLELRVDSKGQAEFTYRYCAL